LAEKQQIDMKELQELSNEINNPHSEYDVASIDNIAIGYLKINCKKKHLCL
jgi:hypothetical protein